MKIDKITICNLTAIEGEQVIDFTKEPLRSAGLFAITGNTGAGKSTILDAVCLALYDRAPRFEGQERIKSDDLNPDGATVKPIQANDVRGILRRGCKEGYARVEFTTPDGSRYEAGWSLRLKRTGNYDRQVRTLRCLAPHKETIPPAEIADRIVDIIGLDYAQFTRTVMLAQNSFANFLRAKRDEKSALLEKLTGTEIYGRISSRIHVLTAEAVQAVDALDNIIRGIMHDHLCPEDLDALTEEQRLVKAAAAALGERIDLTGRQLQWLADFDEATRRVADAEAAHAAANKDCMAMRGDELRLERYDAVLGVQPLYQEIVMRRSDIDDIRRQEAENAALTDAERRRLDSAAAGFDAARERVAEAEGRLLQRRPAISRGHVLSGEISEADAQLRRTEEELAKARLYRDERATLLTAKREETAATARQLEASRLHQQALSVHRLMFEKFDLVKDKLSALIMETKRNQESHKKTAELQQLQTTLKAGSEKVEKKQHDDEDKMATLKSELLIHRQSNQGHDSVKLQQRCSDNRNRLLGLERAKALWQRISTGYEVLDDKRAELARLTAAQEQLVRDEERAAREAAVFEEAYKHLSVSYTLSQSEDIVNLRKQLKEGTACPVCGATHHPYHTETERELGELLNNLEKEFNEASEERAARQAALADLHRRMATGEALISAGRANLAEREARQSADVEEWQACAGLDASFADCSPTVSRDARRLMIDLLIDNTRRDADEAEKELETFNFHQGHINRLNEQIGALEALMAEDRARIDDLRTQFRIATAAAEEAERIRDLSDRTCATLYQDLDAMVTLSGWFTEWKNNPDGFRLRLTTLHDDWLHTTKSVDELEHGSELLREELKAVENRLDEAVTHLNRIAETRDAMSETLAAKREELVRLFGQSSPEQEEEALQADVARARAAETDARKAHEDAEGKLRLLQGTQQNLLTTRTQRQAEHSRLMSELDLWLLRFNADHSPMTFAELEAIFTDPRDWKALRNRLDALREALALSVSRLQAAREALMVLRSRPDQPADTGSESREALTATAAALKAEAATQQERLAQISLRLMAHRKSEEQTAAYAAKLEAARANAEEWRRLDSLLGSADGRKFRELAQSYTFGFLVEHANAQLRQLSPRYELRNVPGTLTLEIIDRDMFDEHRYVSSLSGGETFVVSLALALGLASLSGNSLAIGSLFIDEGFGNLDRDSLDLVMTALSNLENNQGRKVGVISHTDQIRSQISPQIRLVKQPAGGRSRIEIG